MNGFHVRIENEIFPAAGLCCHQNLTYENFKSSFGRLCQKCCTKKHAACAAQLFFPIQPIKSLICGIVVAVAVVFS